MNGNKPKTDIPVITGAGCCCAAGADRAAVAATLNAGTVNCRPVPDYLFTSDLDFPVFAVDRVALTQRAETFFLDAGLDRSSWLACNRTLQLTLSALAEALAAAGLGQLEALRGQRVGIALGTTVGCTFNNEEYYLNWKKGLNQDIKPVLRYLDANPATRLQKILGVEGPATVVTNACASGTDAIGVGAQWLRADLCDLVIAGGADELSRIAYHGFAGLLLTSDKPCRPFDQHRQGLNLGEGAGILILEKQRNIGGKSVLGRVLGYGAAGDAHHPTAPHPQGRGLEQAVRQSLAQAELTIHDISYINSHGTGTSANDAAESAALTALGVTADTCPVVSTKGATGHTLGAAGAIEVILTLAALREANTMGTMGCHDLDPRLHPAVLPQGARRALAGTVGISQSLAFGGGNAALVLEANA